MGSPKRDEGQGFVVFGGGALAIATATLQTRLNANVTPLRVVFLGLSDAESPTLSEALSNANGDSSIRPITLQVDARNVEERVADVDAIVIPLNSSIPSSDYDIHFEEVTGFLQRLAVSRARQFAVAGLPVFLVLTRYEQLTGEAAAYFDAKLRVTEATGFGRIALHVRHFSSEELIRQCVQSASRYRSRRTRSRWRLFVTVAGTLGLLLALTAVVAGLIYYRPPGGLGALVADLNSLRLLDDSTAAERLREPLKPRLTRLELIRNHLDFEKLSAEDQDFIDDRLAELETYVDYKTALETVRTAEITTLDELNQAEQRMKELAPPPSYATEWNATEAVQWREGQLRDLTALRSAVKETDDWYRRQIEQLRILETFAEGKPPDVSAWGEWIRRGGQALAADFPHSDRDAYYADAFRFEPVAAARSDYGLARDRFERLRQWVAALGMAGSLDDGSRQPLDIGTEFTLDAAGSRVRRLEESYPEVANAKRPPPLPDAVAAAIRSAAQRSHDRLMDCGAETVQARLRHSGATRETHELWIGLLPWLTDPPDLREWRKLATVLRLVIDPTLIDPVRELADFIRRDRFDVDIRRATLEIPSGLGFTPTGPLTIYKGATDAAVSPVHSLKLADANGTAGANLASFVFLAEQPGLIALRPGEFFFASAPVKKEGDGDQWMLTWARRRSEVYPFECLNQPPRLHRKGQTNTDGELLENVVLKTSPQDGVPRVPALIPVVRLKPE